MAASHIKAIFQADVQTLWNLVTSLQNYSWRSDLSAIEVINEKQFVEYTKDGYGTTFTITACEPFKRWEFDMENSNMKGRWVGIFSSENGETEIDFTEYAAAKRTLLKPFVKGYLKKQQRRYIADLRKALS